MEVIFVEGEHDLEELMAEYIANDIERKINQMPEEMRCRMYEFVLAELEKEN